MICCHCVSKYVRDIVCWTYNVQKDLGVVYVLRREWTVQARQRVRTLLSVNLSVRVSLGHSHNFVISEPYLPTYKMDSPYVVPRINSILVGVGPSLQSEALHKQCSVTVAVHYNGERLYVSSL